jgi:hypothetical protein
MPANAADTYCTVQKYGTATFMARIVGADGTPVQQTDITAVSYGLFLLDDQDADARTPVAEHDDVDLTEGEVLFDVLQTDFIWTVDAVGYNFRHTLDVSENPAFEIAGRRYLLEYRLTPAVGQMILVRFRVNVI